MYVLLSGMPYGISRRGTCALVRFNTRRACAALLRTAVPVILPFPILWAIEEARRIQEYDGKEKMETAGTPE